MRFSGDIAAQIWIQYEYANGQLSEKYKARLFQEPNSDRFIASVLQPSMREVIQIRYTAESISSVSFINGGIYDPKENESSGTDNLTPPIPNISDVDKPKIISRVEWGARNPKYD